MTTLFIAAVLAPDIFSPSSADTARASWLANLDPSLVQPGPGRFVFLPRSRADDVAGYWQVEAAGAGDVLRVVSFARGETDEGLDIAAPIIVEARRVRCIG